VNLENVGMLELAADHLGDLLPEVVFVGGATVELWITDQAAPEFRPTDDIDVIVEVATHPAYQRFGRRIIEAGFRNDVESGVICRFKHRASGLVLDVMPTEASILGFTNRWQAKAFGQAVEIALPSGQPIRAVPPPYLLATKLEAFTSRGEGDLYGSRDLGDAIVLIDGREELVSEVSNASDSLRGYTADRLDELTGHLNFDAGVEGALPMGPETRARVDQVIRPRIDELILGGRRLAQ
jgi:hypothetical protein